MNAKPPIFQPTRAFKWTCLALAVIFINLIQRNIGGRGMYGWPCPVYELARERWLIEGCALNALLFCFMLVFVLGLEHVFMRNNRQELAWRGSLFLALMLIPLGFGTWLCFMEAVQEVSHGGHFFYTRLTFALLWVFVLADAASILLGLRAWRQGRKAPWIIAGIVLMLPAAACSILGFWVL